jgi:hypothetical protein
MEARLSDEGPSGADFSHPIYDPVRPALERLARETDWPDAERLNLLARELGAAPRTASGRPVRFVAPRPEDANYELRVHASGEVATRPRNWHDLFNALAWITFPRTKAVLNARHAAQIPREGGRRGPLRDLLTIFDEGGAIVASADPGLVELIRAFRWHELFWQRRADVLETMRFVIVGHAVLEQARSPWPGITCKALFVPLDEPKLRLPPAQFFAYLDQCAAAWLEAATGDLTPRALAPLPVFGYPGWFPGSEREAFYADTRYFRPLRRTHGRVESARESARQSLRASAEESPGSVERDAG